MKSVSPEIGEQFRRAASLVCGFSLSFAVWLAVLPLLGRMPAGASDIIGALAVSGYSKKRDYLAALLFYGVVPFATILIARALDSLRDAMQRQGAALGIPWLISLLVSIPLLMAPWVGVITGKPSWSLTFPACLLGIHILAAYLIQKGSWSERLITNGQLPYHTLVVCEGAAAMLFTYLIRGKRLSSAKTLLLELPIIVIGIGGVWIVATLIARIFSHLRKREILDIFPRVAIGATPLLLLPIFGLTTIVREWFAFTVPVVAITIGVTIARGWSIEPKRLRRLLIFVVIPALLYCLSIAGSSWAWNWSDLFHRGETLGPASDYLRGKAPYRDVFVLHGMMENGWLDAQLMSIFGREAWVSTFRLLALGGLIVPILWFLGILLFDSIPLALLIACGSWLTFAGNYRPLFLVGTAVLMIAGLERARHRLVFLAGMVAAIGLFSSFDIGLFSIAGGVAAVILWPLFKGRAQHGEGDGSLAGRSEVSLLRQTAAFSVGVVAGALPFLIYLAVAGALGSFLEASFVTMPSMIDAAWSIPWPDLRPRFNASRGSAGLTAFFLSPDFRFLLNPLVIVTASLLLIVRKLRGAELTHLDRALLALTIFSLFNQRSAIGRADFTHQFFAAALIWPMIVLLFVFAFRWARNLPGDWRGAATTVTAVAAGLLLFVLWLPDLTAARIDETSGHRRRLGRKGTLTPQERYVRQRIRTLNDSIDRYAPPEAAIFDFSNQPALYFFANRPNPTRYYQVPVMSSPHIQSEVIEALEKDLTPVVLKRSSERYHLFDDLSNDDRAAGIAAYIADKYTLAEQVEGTEIWTRRVDRPARPTAEYLASIRPASLIGPPPDQWLLFPSVANLTLGTSHWVSDLSIHNPWPQAIELIVSYHTDRHMQRPVTVPPQQTLLLRDIVKTQFFQDGTRGALLVEHAKGRKPLVSVVTYETASGVPPAAEQPVDMDDAAEAGTGARLVITASQSAGRRVNLGVVNVGKRRAQFRIRALSALGAPLGEPFLGEVAELNSFVLTNGSSQLNIPFDAGVSLIIEPLNGTIAAYASVTDLGTGETRMSRASRIP